MKRKPFAFRLIIACSSLAFAGVASAILVYFRSGAAARELTLAVSAASGLAFALVALIVIGRNGRHYSADFPALSSGRGEYSRALEELGGTPLKSLIAYLAFVIIYIGALAAAGGAIGMPAKGRGAILLLVFSFGMLSAAFLYVLSDKLVLTTLLGYGLVLYPAELKENRQQKKNFIIPTFLAVMCMIFSYSAVLAFLSGAAEGTIADYERRLAGPVLGLSGAFLVVVVILMIVWNSNTALLFTSVTRQLELLCAAEKDLTGRINIGSVDEIASIAGLVNSFCDAVGGSVREIGSIHRKLSDIQERLFAGIKASSSSAGDIAAGIDRTRGLIERGDDAVRQSLERAKELASHAAGVATMAKDQSGRVSASVERVVSVIDAVGSLAKESEGIRDRTSRLVETFHAGETNIRTSIETVKAVALRSSDLAEINKLISAVAARTNLLAMNASIEAAHAGEAGRGFSVVADEIRKLAESTADHTRKSKESLGEILSLIGRAQGASESSGSSFAAIRGSIEELNGVVSEIARAMASQELRNKEILDLLGETERLASGVAETARSLDEIAAGMTQSLGSAADESRQASELAVSMGRRNEELRRAVAEVDALATETARLDGEVAAKLAAFRA